MKLHKSKTSKKFPYNYNYTISSWIWINPQPASTSDAYNRSTTLLNYGDILKINFNKNKIEILAATTENNNKKDKHHINNKIINVCKIKEFAYQKWNNIILNYSGGTLDVFINNKLISSTENISPILSHNKVTCGSSNGINGGIKNIVYYDYNLSKFKIYAIYNLLNV